MIKNKKLVSRSNPQGFETEIIVTIEKPTV